MTLPSHFREQIADSLAGKRLIVDVSVLLAGILDPDSASGEVFQVARGCMLLLSAHVEAMARTVLRVNAPGLIPEFNDGLLRLGARQSIERLPRQAPTKPASKLSAEDSQVLADAVGGMADILVTHDAALFRAAPKGLSVQSPSTLVWDPLDGRNIQRGVESTFIGWFVPQWSSEAVAGSSAQFYYFEIDRFARAYYEAKKGTARLEWGAPDGVRGSLAMPQTVRTGGYHFVAAVLALQYVFFFVDGVSRGRKVRAGAPPQETTFHPFMDGKSEHQIFGGAHFRVEPRVLGEAELRRLWASHSTRLSDGEVNFAKWTEHSAVVLSPANLRIIKQPA